MLTSVDIVVRNEIAASRRQADAITEGGPARCPALLRAARCKVFALSLVPLYELLKVRASLGLPAVS
jgi:hypothetical protein